MPETVSLDDLWVQPVADQTLVRPLFANNDVATRMANAGIVAPDTMEAGRPEIGEVLATGPGTLNPDGTVSPMNWQDGDLLLFSRYGGIDLRVGGENTWLIRRQDVLARLVHKET